MEAQEVINKLGLSPLDKEGGYYKETFRDSEVLDNNFLSKYNGARNVSTSIYYLITPNSFSKLHKVISTEIFHFYAGDPVEMVQISSSGDISRFILGNDLLSEERPQIIVPPNIWQGTKLLNGNGKWALLGCTVAPGFDFKDFTLGDRINLINQYPQHSTVINNFI